MPCGFLVSKDVLFSIDTINMWKINWTWQRECSQYKVFGGPLHGMEWRECGYVTRTPVHFSTFQVAPGEDLGATLFIKGLTNTFM